VGDLFPQEVDEPGRDWYFTDEQPAPAPHLARPEGRAALRIALITVPRASRSCEHFPDGFDLHLLHLSPSSYPFTTAAPAVLSSPATPIHRFRLFT